MTIIFRAKTDQGYIMKLLAELLQNNIKDAGFQINETGIFLKTIDSNQSTFIDLQLSHDKFNIYKFISPTPLHVGLNVSHYHKMLKSIKKSDAVELYIDDENRTDFGIKIFSKANNKMSESVIKIQTIQTIDVELPKGYKNSIPIPSPEFQKMIKSMTSVSSEITIKAKNYRIRFEADAGGIMKKNTEFGETNENYEDETPDYIYNEVFNSMQLSKISKLSGVNSSSSGIIQVFPNEEALLFKSQVGTLGNISIYIKSKKKLAEESMTKDDSDDE